MSNKNQNWPEGKPYYTERDAEWVPTEEHVLRAGGSTLPALREGGYLRRPNGKMVRPGSIYYSEAFEYAYDKAVEIEATRRFGVKGVYDPEHVSRRGSPALGTYRSARRAKDKLREAERTLSCVICGGPIPNALGRRSDVRTCSDAHRTALSRLRKRQRAEGTLALVRVEEKE